MKVVIFCGGFGVRMGEETKRSPTDDRVGNRPIIWHIMKWYASWGYDDFVLCLGYKAESVKEYFLTYNEALSKTSCSRTAAERFNSSGATSPIGVLPSSTPGSNRRLPSASLPSRRIWTVTTSSPRTVTA